MFRSRAASIAAALLFVGCGGESSPTGPETVRISLTVDWPAVHEAGLTHASWKLIELMPPDQRDVVVREGSFRSSGIAEIRFTTTCYASGSTGYRVEYGPHSWGGPRRDVGRVCGVVPHKCIEENQRIIVHGPSFPPWS